MKEIQYKGGYKIIDGKNIILDIKWNDDFSLIEIKHLSMIYIIYNNNANDETIIVLDQLLKSFSDINITIINHGTDTWTNHKTFSINWNSF